MFNFLRRIRQKVISENHFRKYLLYATGEIVLVVIGILIALQVNEWNQYRKDQKEEQAILKNLKSEFLQNKATLQEVQEILHNSQKSSIDLMNLMNKDHLILEQINLDSLIFWTVEYYPFNPSNNVFSDLVQSGRLQLLENDSLRNTIFTWSTELENYRNSFEEYQNFVENHMLGYYIDHIALKNVDQYGPLQWRETSSFPSDHYEMFKDRKYENLIDNHLYHASLLENHFHRLQGIIETILSLSD